MAKKILLVDDEPRILSLLHSLLRTEGLEAISAKDGQAAIEILKSQKIDLLITDIRMTPMDGMELFRAARVESPPASQRPVQHWPLAGGEVVFGMRVEG